VDACTRLPAGKAARIDQLIDAGAWNDAALALIELELPAWKLRRLVYEDGEWLCSLSRQPNLPLALDDTADARHEVADPNCVRRSAAQGQRDARNQFADSAASPADCRAMRFVATTSPEQCSERPSSAITKVELDMGRKPGAARQAQHKH
jgi:hypothetical protein